MTGFRQSLKTSTSSGLTHSFRPVHLVDVHEEFTRKIAGLLASETTPTQASRQENEVFLRPIEKGMNHRLIPFDPTAFESGA